MAPFPFLTNVDQAAVAQHLHVMRQCGLGDAELLQQAAGAHFTLQKRPHDAQAIAVAQRLADQRYIHFNHTLNSRHIDYHLCKRIIAVSYTHLDVYKRQVAT